MKEIELIVDKKIVVQEEPTDTIVINALVHCLELLAPSSADVNFYLGEELYEGIIYEGENGFTFVTDEIVVHTDKCGQVDSITARDFIDPLWS